MDAEPAIATLEDYVPLDPRYEVLGRNGSDVFRLFAGGRERPISDLSRTQRIASVVDEHLVSLKGFGLRDLTELSLRYMEHVIERLAPHWLEASIDSPSDPAILSEDELDAADGLASIGNQVALCDDPERAARALDWVTADVTSLRFRLSDPNSAFGRTMSLQQTPVGSWSLPAAFQMDALAQATRDLSVYVGTRTPEAERKFASLIETLVLDRLGHRFRVLPNPRTMQGNEIAGLAILGERHAIAIGTASSLRFERMNRGVGHVLKQLEGFGPGVLFRLESQGHRIPPNCEVVRLTIGASSSHAVTPVVPGYVLLTLEDFLWMMETADDPDDIYFFCREWADLPGIQRMISLEVANAWEYWRANQKALHRTIGGFSMVITPHQTDEEWRRRSELAWAERLLAQFSIKPLESWTGIDLREDYRIDLTDFVEGEGWRISRHPFPLAVRAMTPDFMSSEFSWVPALSEALAFKITHLFSNGTTPAWAANAEDGVRVLFRRVSPEGNEFPIRLGETADRTVILDLDSRGVELELLQPGTLEVLVGFHLALGLERLGILSPGDVSMFLEAWSAVQRALSIDAYPVTQQVREPPAPLKPHASVRSAALRELASVLRDREVAPGRFLGAEAVDFENTHVYPVLLEQLSKAWLAFSFEQVLQLAMRELDRAAAERERDRQQLFFNVTRIPVTFDPIDKSLRLSDEASRLTRAMTTLIEFALRQPPIGNQTPDEIDFRSMLSISELALESALRSEAAHYALLPVETELSDLLEVNSRVVDEGIKFNGEEFQRAMGDFDLENAQKAEEAEASPGKGLLAVFPELTGIDEAFRVEHGCGLEVFLQTIVLMAEAPVTPEDQVATYSLEGLVEFLTSFGTASAKEFEAAVSLLALRQDDIQAAPFEPWAFRERDVRLATRPILVNPVTGQLHIMPWWMAHSFQVYERYLRGGRLPWKDPGTGAVNRALEEYRSTRNRQLEDEVAALVSKMNLPHMARVKKGSVLGLDALSGEIDVILAEPTRQTLWVLEVKDPAESFSVAEISRAIRAFVDEGGYADKLARKVRDVEAGADHVVQKLLGRGESGWSVRGALVTRRPVPAAFVSPLPFPILSSKEVASLVLTG